LKRSHRRAFTLLETLVVLGIIGVLLTLFFKGFHFVVEKKNIKKAKLEIVAIKTALENYYLHHGDYPVSCENKICTNEEILFLSLAGFKHDEIFSDSKIVRHPNLIPSNLMNFDLDSFDMSNIPDSNHQGGNSIALWFMETLGRDPAFLDPWGKKYVYEYPREDGESGFLLYSMGPDGRTEREFSQDDLN